MPLYLASWHQTRKNGSIKLITNMTTKLLNKALIERLHDAATVAGRAIADAGPENKGKLEEVWDVEHAYYSSALEGSNIDRKEFETLAKETK